MLMSFIGDQTPLLAGYFKHLLLIFAMICSCYVVIKRSKLKSRLTKVRSKRYPDYEAPQNKRLTIQGVYINE